jgi:hypothetical protein
MASATGGAPYKVIELGEVTDRSIEEALNGALAEGCRFESIHFVSQQGSRRPVMAFLFFTRPAAGGPEG